MVNKISAYALANARFSAGRSEHHSRCTGTATVRMLTDFCRDPAHFGERGRPLLAVARIVAQYGDTVKQAGTPGQRAYDAAKGTLPWATPAALFAPNLTLTSSEAKRGVEPYWYDHGRRAGSEPHTPTGLVITEVDGQSQDGAVALRDLLFDHPAVLSVRLSASRKGVHILTAVKPPDGGWTQDAYHAVWGEVVGQLGLRERAEAQAAADKSVKDYTRLLFLSYDPDTRLKEDVDLRPIVWSPPHRVAQRPMPQRGRYDDIGLAQDMLESLLPHMGSGSGTYDRCIGAAGLALDVGVSEDWVRDWYRRVRPTDAKVDGQLPRAGNVPLVALSALDTLQASFTGQKRIKLRKSPVEAGSGRQWAVAAATERVESDPVEGFQSLRRRQDEAISLDEWLEQFPPSPGLAPWCERCAKENTYHRLGSSTCVNAQFGDFRNMAAAKEFWDLVLRYLPDGPLPPDCDARVRSVFAVTWPDMPAGELRMGREKYGKPDARGMWLNGNAISYKGECQSDASRNKARRRATMRGEIDDQIEPLRVAGYEIDHQYQFSRLLADWLASVHLTLESEELALRRIEESDGWMGFSQWALADRKLAGSWREYHRRHARLCRLTPEEHRAKSRAER